MKILPIVYTWQEIVLPATGEVILAMVPKPRYEKTARQQFVVSEEYPLQIIETRSRASHNHFFASVHDAYSNLPETVQARWLNEDHMRKWVLCEIGYYDEDEIEFDTRRDAQEFARHCRKWDERLPTSARDYARLWVTQADGNWKVIRRTAKSQSAAAMGKDAFQASKKAVLEYLDDGLGVKRGTLSKQGRAA